MLVPMSAFPESRRSPCWKTDVLRGRLRPEADINNSDQIPFVVACLLIRHTQMIEQRFVPGVAGKASNFRSTVHSFQHQERLGLAPG